MKVFRHLNLYVPQYEHKFNVLIVDTDFSLTLSLASYIIKSKLRYYIKDTIKVTSYRSYLNYLNWDSIYKYRNFTFKYYLLI